MEIIKEIIIAVIASVTTHYAIAAIEKFLARRKKK